MWLCVRACACAQYAHGAGVRGVIAGERAGERAHTFHVKTHLCFLLVILPLQPLKLFPHLCRRAEKKKVETMSIIVVFSCYAFVPLQES